jgi:hypothetical protein
MAARTARAVETRKKKNSRRIARPAQTRNQGNTAGARTKARKQALLKAGRPQPET